MKVELSEKEINIITAALSRYGMALKQNTEKIQDALKATPNSKAKQYALEANKRWFTNAQTVYKRFIIIGDELQKEKENE